MKEQTPIEHKPSKECERIEKLINHFLSASGVNIELLSMCREGIDEIINIKVLEALEKEVKQAFEMGKSELYHNERGLNVNYATAEQYYETEVKPKYNLK